MNAEPKIHESGAASSGDLPPLYLVPYSLVEIAGQRLLLGALKYDPWNWEKGMHDRGFILDRCSHLVRHSMLAAEKFSKGDWNDETNSDDDLAAVAANLVFLVEYRKRRRAELAQPSTAPNTAKVPHMPPGR